MPKLLIDITPLPESPLGLAGLLQLLVAGLYGGAAVDAFDRRKIALALSMMLWQGTIGVALQAWFSLENIWLLLRPHRFAKWCRRDQSVDTKRHHSAAVALTVAGGNGELVGEGWAATVGGVLCIALMSVLAKWQQRFARHDGRHPEL